PDAGTVANGLLKFTVTAQATGFGPNVSGSLSHDGSATPSDTEPAAANGIITLTASLSGGPNGTSHPLVVTAKDSGGHQPPATLPVTGFTPPAGACAITISPTDETLFNEPGTAVTIASQTFNTVQDEDRTAAGMQARITAAVGPPCIDGTAVTLTVGSA